MLAKVAVPVAGVGLAVAGGFKVHAASHDKPPGSVKKYDLPIYPSEDQKIQDMFFYEEEIGPFRQQIQKARQALWTHMEKIQGTTDNAKRSFNAAKDKTNSYFRYIQEDAGLMHKACIITVCGLGGVVAGYRGGPVKKTFLSVSGMTAAAALCYPYQAVELADSAYSFTKDAVVKVVWKPESNVADRRTMPKVEVAKVIEVVKEPADEPAKCEDSKSNKSEDTKSEPVKPEKDSSESKNKKSDNKGAGDFGMSKKEDQDMYTTRQ